MPRTLPIVYVVLFCTLAGCVSQKKFNTMKAEADDRYTQLDKKNKDTQESLAACKRDLDAVTAEKGVLAAQLNESQNHIGLLKENNTTMLQQMQDLSVVTSSQAESIKRSIENIGAKDIYIQDLQKEMTRKDSLNMALVLNLKGAIGDMNDKDINIKVDKGVVFVDISDKLLFASGQYDIKPRAREVLGKVALVLKAQPDLEFMVEGHTDNVKYSRPPLLDNWDLSVKRATAVVRLLQKEYGLDPAHITAAGRSEFVPLASNETPEGRAANRRTRIVILPELDQFFQLLETK
jgi:chemotaxis protein MotB